MTIPMASHITPTAVGNIYWYRFQLGTFLTALVCFQWLTIKVMEGILFVFRKKIDRYDATSLFANLIVLGYFLFLMVSYFKFDRY